MSGDEFCGLRGLRGLGSGLRRLRGFRERPLSRRVEEKSPMSPWIPMLRCLAWTKIRALSAPFVARQGR